MRIDNQELLKQGSDEEVEIRAATIWACELLRRAMQRQGYSMNAADIDSKLWFLSQNTERMRPYHRVYTQFLLSITFIFYRNDNVSMQVPTLQQLLVALEQPPIRTVATQLDTSVAIQGITYDSRKVKEGWLFVAVPGVHTDGRRFIIDAAKRGAVVALGEAACRATSHSIH